MKNHALLTLAAASLAGCMSTGTGTVQAIGKDSFTIRILSEKSASDAKQKALVKANAHCGEKQRNLQLVQEMQGTEENGQKFYDATFYCLPQGDQDFTRYRPQTQSTQPQPSNP